MRGQSRPINLVILLHLNHNGTALAVIILIGIFGWLLLSTRLDLIAGRSLVQPLLILLIRRGIYCGIHEAI